MISTVERVFRGHLLLAALGLAVAYGFAPKLSEIGLVWLAIAPLVIGGLWFLGRLRKAGSYANLFLILSLIAAGIGALTGGPAWLVYLASIAILGAWDLDQFLRRLQSTRYFHPGSGMVQKHLRRLAVVEGLSFVVGLAALFIRTNLPFWWEVGIVLTALIGLRLVIYLVRRDAAS